MRLFNKLWITALLFLAAAPAFALEDAARPEAMIGFFAKASPQPNRSFMQRVAAAEGRVVLASWYGGGESLNSHTASGERFRPSGLTAAHRTLPMGTRLALSYGGRTVIARVNDRGPAAWTGRSLDVSRGVAAALGFKARGTAHIRMAVLRS